MRLLLLSDIHSDEYTLERITKLCEQQTFDYIFIAGDIATCAISFLEDFLDRISKPKCFAIPGNCDLPEVLKMLEERMISVHEKRIELADGFNLVGFGFSALTPFHTHGELTEEEIEKRMSKLKIDRDTLLLTHAPPYGVLDEARGIHIGSKSIRDIIEKRKPFANFCGHAHEIEGKKELCKTIVIKIPAAKLGRYLIVKITNKKLTVQFLKL